MFATTKHSRNCLKRDPVPSEVENTAAGCAKWLKLEMVCNALCRDSLLCSVVKIILKRVAINSMRYLNKLKMSESQIEATFGLPI